MNLALSEPSQPSEEDWCFIEDLKAPLWKSLRFQKRKARRNEVPLQNGVRIHPHFPDPQGLLETAYADLDHFFEAGKIRLDGDYPIFIRREETDCREAYRVQVRGGECVISANDTEGARRGIFFLQDEILRTGGAFLPLGVTARHPQIRTRLSRCFFGPINRPPKRRDELMDDVDYYPDAYLNRLAHEGVNALWLTVNFRDLCPSRFFPEDGRDSARRLEKLRRVVRKCSRHGIRIYIFCIEPKGFGNVSDYLRPPADLERHPGFGGHRTGDIRYFCPGTPEAQSYLEECTHHIFSEVPGLGGMMGINLGERPTHCCSNFVWDLGANNCPRCAKREPWQVFRDTLTPLARGMHRANPDAELISWLYVPYLSDREERRRTEAEKMIGDLAAHLPANVTLQYNFESMGTLTQLGKRRFVRDYSLAYVGPSGIFRACARARKAHGGRMAAKLQVGCSHEVATVPFVPAPANLYEKYRTMHELGVSGAMQSWYFGSSPSLMTKAAGELSFAPFPRSEKAFLQRLAAIGWGEDGPVMARAWSLFSTGYRHFPANLAFAWYGPVHDAVVWPLHLKPLDAPISPSWLLGFPPSGDRIGECVGFEHNLEEAIALCEKMRASWEKGIRLILPLAAKYRHQRERRLEIGVAQAMNLQIASALNILKFYAEREKFYAPASRRNREKSLRRLRGLVEAEIENSTRMEKLARADSRLGFHSEAEGYKYFPAKLRWRINLLRRLLRKDFPDVERLVRSGGELPSPDHPSAGEKNYPCAKIARPPDKRDWPECPEACLHPARTNAAQGWKTSWRAAHDEKNLYFRIHCQVPPDAPELPDARDFTAGDHLRISLEPRRFWPTREFNIGRFGDRLYNNREVALDRHWRVKTTQQAGGWEALVTLPFSCLKTAPPSSLRLNIERTAPGLGRMAWVPRHSENYRLIFGDLAPADLGWIELLVDENS